MNRNKGKNSTVFYVLITVLLSFVVIVMVVFRSPSSEATNQSSGIQTFTNFTLSTPITPKTSMNSPTKPPPATASPKQKEMSEEMKKKKAIQDIRQLRDKAIEFLDFATGTTGAAPSYLRWDQIAKADVHIVYKLIKFLDYHLNSTEQINQLYDLYKYGRKCTPLDAAQQELISKFISMDICSEIEWYKLVQLAWPQAKIFFDIGANKGYLGSLFIALWGGGKLQVSPADVYHLAMSMNAWKGARNPSGYCKDGENYGVQLHCKNSQHRDLQTGRCLEANPNIEVYSFDGSSYLTKTLAGMIQEKLFVLASQDSSLVRADGKPLTSIWSYNHYAIYDREGIAHFTKQDQNYHAGYEGGGIKGVESSSGSGGKGTANSASTAETEAVPMISLDIFAKNHSISSVDVLKIDAEGNDNRVLLGARGLIAKPVGMLTFEGGQGITLSKEMLDAFDLLGYACYSTSRAGLFKWNGQCMKTRYMGGFRAKDKGNVFCINRYKAPLAALAYEALSFPSTIHLFTEQYYESRNDNSLPNRDAIKYMLEELNNTRSPSSKGLLETIELYQDINPSVLVPLYVNIYGFCKPWPSCAKI
jgi:FkbM family methyltransferase